MKLIHVHAIQPFSRVIFLCLFQRQGRSDTFATEFDLEAEEYVPLPKGDVHKKKEIVQDVTLHDLDVANARPQVSAERDDYFQHVGTCTLHVSLILF